jgi:uncharacterized protein
MKIVLDTNTVISGLFWKGAPRQVLDLARRGLISLYTSPDLLAELADVLGREKFIERLKLAQVTVDELLYGYAALAQVILPVRLEPVVEADPDDDKVLACAKTAQADLIVSGDIHLLDLKEFEEIKIVTVNEVITKFI